MKRSILALSIGTFALGIAEFVVMGILSNLADDFHITDSQAGHIISAYALGVSIGAPVLLFFRKYRLKSILLFLTAMMIAGNVLTALSPNYAVILVARLISGLPHGAYFGVGAIMARNLADKGHEAMAVSMMVAGMTIATTIGVPTGTFLCDTVSWRLTFVIVAVAALTAFIMIRKYVPGQAPLPSANFTSQFLFLKKGAPWLIFAGVFFGQTGIYCWYSYIDPLMQNVAGFSSGAMTWIMTVAGLGMFAGTMISGRLADRYNPARVTSLIALFSIGVLTATYFLADIRWAVIPLTFLGTAGLFGIGGPLQSLIVKYSRGGEMLGAAGIQISFNVGNAIAALIGGAAISSGLGYNSTALIGIPLVIISVAALVTLYRHYERQR